MIFKQRRDNTILQSRISGNPSMTSSDQLAVALDAYRRDFEQKISEAPNEEAKRASVMIAEAKRIVGQSGLAPALAPTLVEEVQHWHEYFTWSNGDDFSQYVNFPATDIIAGFERGDDQSERTTVYFSYEGSRYGVVLVDGCVKSGMSGDAYHHGKAEFIANSETVLGLEIAQDLEIGSRWRWFNLFAFRVVCLHAFPPRSNVVCFAENLMFFKDSYDSFHSMCAVKVNTSLPLFFLTSAQIRAARSLIRWTAEDLASASALSVATIRRAELKKNQTALTSANDLAIRRALESAGVQFIDENGGGPGVRLRKRQQKTGSRSNCKRRLSLRWLPPVERVGGADK